MSEVIYNPLEDNDVNLPVYKKDGKNLVMPAFICGVKVVDIQSRAGDELTLAELAFEIHESAEKVEQVTIYEEDEYGNYNYRAPKETVPGSAFVGKRVKTGNNGKIWKNNSKGSGKMNRIYLETLKSLGIEIKTKKVEHDGKKIDAQVVPDITEEMLLGIPVFIWLDQESFTGRDGKNVTYTCVNKYVKSEAFERVEVLENTLDEAAKARGKSAPKEDDPFADMDDDLPF